MTTFANIAGLLDIGFAMFHLAFWRLFGWDTKLSASGAVNAAITQTLNLVLTYVFVVYGASLLWLSSKAQGASAPLLWAGAGFWMLRLVLQPALFSMGNLPSRLITVVFAVTAAVHAAAALAA